MSEKHELEKKLEQLEKLNAFKSDVISISAHELRTSLTAMRWITEMLLSGDSGELKSEQKSLIEKDQISIERLLALVQEMLTINHTETVGLTYKFAPTDAISLIEGVLFDFTGESYKRSVETVFLKPPEKIAPVKADTDKIRVVLQNLIENAIKYSKSGSKVIINIAENDGFVRISVKDNGIGISEDDKEKIFEKFYRGEKARAEHAFGSGLGLYTAKKIVEGHGGEIGFESKDGEGSTFYFTLPIAK